MLASSMLLMVTSLAQAQSYTATLLKRPSGADSCSEVREGASFLSVNGDVSTTCTMLNVAFLGAPFLGTSKATVWRAGSATARTLAGTLTLPRTNANGMLSDGTVVGVSYGSGNSAAPSAWKTTTRANYPMPAGYSGWEIDRTSPDGQTVLIRRRNDGSAYGHSFALIKAGVARAVTPPPAACGSLNGGGEHHSWVINNLGHMAIGHSKVIRVPNASDDEPGTVCIWDGDTWHVSPRTPNFTFPDGTSADSYELNLQAFSDQGEVLVNRIVKFTWHATQGFKQVNARARTFTSTGEIAGGAEPTSTDYREKAVLWRNGQPVQLSEVATAPAGYQLSTVLATNPRGQVLVLAQALGDTVASTLKSRLVLLTPR